MQMQLIGIYDLYRFYKVLIGQSACIQQAHREQWPILSLNILFIDFEELTVNDLIKNMVWLWVVDHLISYVKLQA